MPMKRINSYQALWHPKDNKGFFWFTYTDGERQRTIDLESESFRIVLEILNTDKPIFGDHATAAVAVHWLYNERVVQERSEPLAQKVINFGLYGKSSRNLGV